MPALADRERQHRETSLRRCWRPIRSALSGMTQIGTASRLMVADYAITMKGVAGFDPRDVYHLVVALSWPHFLLLAVTPPRRSRSGCGTPRSCRSMPRAMRSRTSLP
jgi:hypothetical protein